MEVKSAVAIIRVIKAGVIEVGSQGFIGGERRPIDTFLPQIAHKELQADESEHAETEDGQDHDICQLLHRLNQSSDDGFQT